MASTNFIDGITTVLAAWLNNVNVAVYSAIGDGVNAPTTPAQVRTNLGLGPLAILTTVPIASGGTGATTAIAALLALGERTSTTGTLSVPLGSTAQRDVSLGTGIRYNSSLAQFEGYSGATWGSLGGGGGAPVSLASTATTDIGVQVSQAVEISGTTAITSFGTNYNGPRFLRFTGALVLTQSAALNLPGGVSITTVAGDTAIAYPNQSLNGWNVVSYTKADGTAVTAGMLTPLVRQTVLSGPVDTNGQSAFGGATSSTVVTASGTLIATAANGWVTGGSSDRVGSIVNPSWTGLTTNGTMYLNLQIASTGVCTPIARTVQPIEIQGSAAAYTTAGQMCTSISQMSTFIGNGSVVAQAWEVKVGEVTVAAGVVTAITWYALNGRYSRTTSTLPATGSAISQNHNLGVQEAANRLYLINITPQNGFNTGEIIENYFQWDGAGVLYGVGKWAGRLSGGFSLITGYALYSFTKSTGAVTATAPANWAYTLEFKRSWGGS